MVETYVTRPLDHNGRVVIPMEIRRAMDIQPDDLLEITAQNGVITMVKHQPGCVFCGETENTIYFQNKPICLPCAAKLKRDYT